MITPTTVTLTGVYMADFVTLQTELEAINARAEQIRLALDEQRHGLIDDIAIFVGDDEKAFRELVAEVSVLGQTKFDLTVMVRRRRPKLGDL